VAHWAFNAGRTITTWENLLGNGKPYNLSPWLPSGCPGYVFHQWSGDRFVLPGMYESTVDMNSYDGSVDDLREWVGLPPLETKDELLAKLETETDNFITRAIQLEKALKEYIQSVKG
jgi:hypothetical protein